ncbi:hypothetical protein [Mesorhizobium sp. M1A.F.Ca.ET.072.01.1.1]|uniref:hypothetical protein n=1 Tax=Mesorhizobium sp. M1A.F.Ca.ET.072.01.1.1 TaxID=2496753 RepID=UPI001672B112|nr:hypothetical protein [Mesorhizobium sp. M1A.F.Ca.ET.072.01.1.1]
MKLGIPAYESANLLDVAGPLEMFSRVDEKNGVGDGSLVDRRRARHQLQQSAL